MTAAEKNRNWYVFQGMVLGIITMLIACFWVYAYHDEKKRSCSDTAAALTECRARADKQHELADLLSTAVAKCQRPSYCQMRYDSYTAGRCEKVTE